MTCGNAESRNRGLSKRRCSSLRATLAGVNVLQVPDWSYARDHIEHRSQRKPGDTDILVGWAAEAWSDDEALVADPDPKTRSGLGVRVIGYSPSAGFVITVTAVKDGEDLWGTSAWRSNKTEQRLYNEPRRDHHE